VSIDFYATWCTPCRELDDITFHHPEVVQLAGRDFVMIKVDLTQKGNQVHQRLLSQYKGLPTVVFLDRQRQECRVCGWWIICRRSRFSAAWLRWVKIAL
jgi:thioredoxin:protein disulfide reductase